MGRKMSPQILGRTRTSYVLNPCLSFDTVVVDQYRVAYRWTGFTCNRSGIGTAGNIQMATCVLCHMVSVNCILYYTVETAYKRRNAREMQSSINLCKQFYVSNLLYSILITGTVFFLLVQYSYFSDDGSVLYKCMCDIHHRRRALFED